jgi:hypothetical protein
LAAGQTVSNVTLHISAGTLITFRVASRVRDAQFPWLRGAEKHCAPVTVVDGTFPESPFAPQNFARTARES